MSTAGEMRAGEALRCSLNVVCLLLLAIATVSAQTPRGESSPAAPSPRQVRNKIADAQKLPVDPVAALLRLLAGSLGRPMAGSQHLSAGPRVTGSDGSQTGTASFFGNFTAITEPAPTLFLLQRQADCSLNFITGTANLTGSTLSLAFAGNVPHYEQTLHQLASLTTIADVYPLGCAEKSTGISTRPGVYVGMPQSGSAVSAFVVSNGNAAAVRTRIYSSPGFTTITETIDAALSSASALATADLNGDSNGDLVVANANFATSSFISVKLGNSDGTFQAPVSYPTAGNYSVAAVIDDVNGDGKLDIVAISNDQQISVLLGNGDGTFQNATSFAAPALPGNSSATATPIVSLITADLRGTGKKDIIGSNGLVLLGNGDGTFTAASAPAFPYFLDPLSLEGPNLASGDLNNDGKLDLLLNNGTSISTWIGKGDGTFTRGTTYATISNTGFVTVSDLDGDGNLDIYTGLANGGLYSGDDSEDATAYVLMGNGDGTFQGAPEVGAGTYTGNNLADVTGSGTLDLITNTVDTPSGFPFTITPTFTVQLGTGKGTFNPVSTITPPASFVLNGTTITGADTAGASTYAVADINGDGKADLVFADNNLTAGNVIFPTPVYFTALSNGDGTFQAPVPHAFPQIAPAADFDISASVTGLQIADLNHDGHQDLILTFDEIEGGTGITTPFNQGFAVLPGNGDGTFQPPILTSTFSSATAPTTALVAQIAAITDLNGDGKPDLVVIYPNFSIATGATTQLQVYLGNGDGTFQTPTSVITASPIANVAIADFNKDGKLDLASLGETASGQAELAISLGNGDGTFQTPTIVNLPDGDTIRHAPFAAADFNGDGNIDLALIDSNSYSGIFYGNGDGTFASVNIGTAVAPVVIPKDLINLALSGTAAAVNFTAGSKPDLLVGNAVLHNIYAAATTPVGSTTSLVASSATLTLGQSVTLTATVAAVSGAAVPTGTVTFLNGSTSLGTGTLNAQGVATLATTALPVGTDSITASYGGDTNFTASVSSAVTVTVSAGTKTNSTTALTASASTIAAGQSVTLTATVAAASGSIVPTGTVTFLNGSSTLGTGTLNAQGVATMANSSLPVGTLAITASYGGDANFNSSVSSAVTITVTAAGTADFTLSLNPATGSVSRAGSVTTTVTITPSGGFNQTVTFACSNLPKNSQCVFSPASDTTTTSLTIKTGLSHIAAVRMKSTGGGGIVLAGMSLCGLLGLVFARGRGRALRTVCFLLVLAGPVGLLSGCGSSSKTPSGSYAVTVTGTAGATSHSASFSLTVQ